MLQFLQNYTLDHRTEKEQTDLLYLLIQHLPIIIEIYNKDGLLVEVNQAYTKLWGLPAETMVGKLKLHNNPIVQHNNMIGYVEKALAGNSVSVPIYKFLPVEKTTTHAPESNKWFQTDIHPIKNQKGQVQYIVLTHEDVTSKRKEMENLHKNKERFRLLVETTSDCIWEVDRNGRYTYISPNIAHMLGYIPDELLDKTLYTLMPDDEKLRLQKILLNIARTKEPFNNVENVRSHKDGSLVTLETSGVPYFDSNNRLAGFRGIDRDISARKQYEKQFLLSESVFTHATEGIVITDKEGTIQRVNEAFTKITEYSHNELIGQNPRILKSDRHNQMFYANMWSSILNKGHWSGEIWNRRKCGFAYPEWLSISAIRDNAGEITNFVSICHDISEDKVNEAQLEFLAFHDPLTNLPNRRLFYDRLRVSLANAERTEKKVALVYMDIDNFKDINDTYGHPFGDDLLCVIKDTISHRCRKSDTFSRFGGDEFVIALNHINNAEEAVSFSENLIKMFKSPIKVNGKIIYTSLSVGLAIFPDHGKDVVTLEKNADMALYRAKQDGKNRVFLYRQDLNDKRQRKLFIENSLRTSCEDFSDFSIMYQPKVDAFTEQIKGVEALIRWNIGGTPISPAEFIPIAEKSNQIVSIGDWVLRRAMKDMKTVHDQGFVDLSVSINLSTKQFINNKLFKTIQDSIEENQFDPTRIYFEITESTSMQDIKQALSVMAQLKELGTEISIDDFGTGYSSLSYLKEFPLKELKIDRSFIRDIPQDKDGATICKTIINMAKSLGYQVVAEGVETKEQLTFLQEHNCNLIQGFYFYKPMRIEDLLKILI